jgi:glucan phosphoethanolaminetransferase (alkaline phosphatase superfamily)
VSPQIRRPLVTWLLTVLTGGIYLCYWAWRVASELNSAEGKKVLNTDFWVKALISLLVAVFVGVLVTLYSGNPIPFFAVALLLFAFFVYVQLSIGNYIKAKDRQLNTGASFSNALSFVLLWMVANVGVAYMQAGINRVITNERARS